MSKREQSIDASKFYIRSLSLYDTALRERKLISVDNEFYDDEFRTSIIHAGLALELILKACGMKLSNNPDHVSSHSWTDIIHEDINPYLNNVKLINQINNIESEISNNNLSGFLTHLSVYNNQTTFPNNLQSLTQYQDFFKNLNLSDYDKILNIYEKALEFYKDRVQITLNTDFLKKGENLIKDNIDVNLNEKNYKEKMNNIKEGINYLLKFLCICSKHQPYNNFLENLMFCKDKYHEVDDIEYGLRQILYFCDMFGDGENFETIISDSKFKYCLSDCQSLLNFSNKMVGNF